MRTVSPGGVNLLQPSLITSVKCFTQSTGRLFAPSRRIDRSKTIVTSAMSGMFANLKSMMQGGPPSSSGGNQKASASTPSSAHRCFFANSAPSWEQMQSMIDAKLPDFPQLAPRDLSTGAPSSESLRRTFGKPGEPRIKLYRDHATWCPYCHTILLQLEEKKIPYLVEKINMRCYGDKPAEFLAKVPSGLLPVIEVDGQIITESGVIRQLLEGWYSNPPLLPPEGTEERNRATSLFRLERRLFSDWLQWLTNGWGNESNRAAFLQTIDAVEKELGVAEGEYFLSSFSLVDVVFAPFLERIVASMAYYKGLRIRGEGRWPNLERWFDALETRPAYMGFRSDFYTHCHDLPPQLGGCVSLPEAAEIAAAIDGTDATSWRLPLPPLNGTSIEPYSLGENPEEDRLMAAMKLVSNHTNVTKFALRGVGKPGRRPVSAPLADPTAIPGMEYETEIDAALRHVAHALLLGPEAAAAAAAVAGAAGSGLLSGSPVEPSLGYLRDRVGVPRDLPLPAARQLRAHLNWFIDLVAGK